MASPPAGASPSPTHSASSSLLSLFGRVKQKRKQGKMGKRERRREKRREKNINGSVCVISETSINYQMYLKNKI
jgi:hypothetical protein